ncbi:MAG: DNA polymerase/3'-5' exonuclease PolX [Thermoplasmata archaeon]|nr:DNA polymerase/3'-5' exonuclease PolX [Thermoplasmata archaeon]
MKNQEIARILYEIADMLDIKNEQFTPRAYRWAARVIEELPEDLEKIRKRGELTGLQGIGKNIAKKIGEYLDLGKIPLHERLRTEIPQGVLDILAVPGMGPKKAGLLYRERGISSLDELEKAARERRIRRLRGFGEKTEKNILKGIEMLKRTKGRMLLGEALPIAEEVVESLRSKVEKISVAGSLRRMKETVGDIDILAVSGNPEVVMDAFSNLPHVEDVALKGKTKTTVYLEGDLQADLRVVESGSFGAALQYFTGSKDHNIHLRSIAQRMGLKINEYGVFEGDEKIGGKGEEEIYELLGMSYIAPELREDAGEIEASLDGKLPDLIELEDVKGDLHVHTDWSDGGKSIQGIAEAAKAQGREYIAITDHSKSLKIANGLSEEELELQIKEVKKVDRKMRDFKILTGIEADIKDNGELDLDDSILKELDVVVGAVHSKFSMPERQMTERMVEAMRNENMDILAHPTGRLIGRRDPYELDIEEIMDEAAETRTALEINCFPDRLDLNGPHARMAKEAGAKISLGTDTHSIHDLQFIKFGVGTARRGWLEKEDVLNTMTAEELKTYLR